MRRALSLLAGGALAVCLSQFPEYAQQYTQRLGGAVDELGRQIAEFDQGAAQYGLARGEALERFAASSDSFLRERGADVQQAISRHEDLAATLERIRSASALERAQMLPDYFDSEIGRRTLENFKPAVPVTPEGFIWAGAGLVLGYLVFSGIIGLIRLPFRASRRVRVTR